MTNQQHWIAKKDLRATQWHDEAPAPLKAGEVRLKVDQFALTANNVTYAAFGGAPMHYWNFYPASDNNFGRVPVWGFATVAESTVSAIEVGRRVYGYLPIATSFVIKAGRVSKRTFSDVADHRKDLAPIYNTYIYTDTDAAYRPEYEAEQMLFRPLFTTGWMICDSLLEADTKPKAVLISSASSKTALATAHALKERAPAVKTIALTSAGNKAFVEGCGLYAETYTYDEVATMTAPEGLAYVDFVGRPALTASLHKQFESTLFRSMVIGVTDWEADRSPPADLSGPTPEFFFVPDYAAARTKTLPQGELDKWLGKDLLSFYPLSRNILKAEILSGSNAIQQAWLDTVDGKISPTRGLICQF